MLRVPITTFHSPVQIKKLVQSRHGTHNALKPTTPNKSLLSSHRVKAIWYFTLWVVRCFAFNILVVADVQFVNYLDNGCPHFMQRGWKGEIFSSRFQSINMTHVIIGQYCFAHFVLNFLRWQSPVDEWFELAIQP